MSITDELDERFPEHRSPGRNDEWELLKQRLSYGRTVTGTVVARSPFGAWVDIRTGFPALLEIFVIAGLTPEKYQADDWCPVGSEVTAFIGGFRDKARQIELWQVPIGQHRQ